MKTIMPPSSSSLFHFTRKWSIFKKILSKGLMYFESIEYCPNDDALSKVVYKNNGIFIIPMICFCDIPISRTLKHRSTYGNYAIGFNKESLRNKLIDNISPVHYISNPEYALYLATIKQDVESLLLRKNNSFCYTQEFVSKIDMAYDFIFYLLSYFKPYEYYDEREWRALLPKNSKWARGFVSWDKNKYDINEYSKAYKKFTKPTNVYISFSSEELANVISYIILPTENDVGKVVEFILSERNSIFGCANVPKETRVMIVSRITSFERIEKDY